MTRRQDAAWSLDDQLREYAIGRDQRLRDELIAAHLGLVHALARRFAHRGEPVEDLAQVGAIGLMNALDRFDPDLGFSFGAYATKTIIGVMKRHFRDKGWSIRAPRRVQELYLRVGQSVEEMSQRLGRSPTLGELASEMGVPDEALIEALEAGNAYRTTSIDAPGLYDNLLSSRLGQIDEEYLHAEERVAIRPHVERLSDRERLIIHLRFSEDLTQAEIARRLGMSQMHVSRLIAASLATLREQYSKGA